MHVGRVAIEKRMNFKQYLSCMKNKKPIRHSFASIKSVKHNLFTVMQKKKALTHFDSKRWLFNCGIHSVSYGHYHIKKYFDCCRPTCTKNKKNENKKHNNYPEIFFFVFSKKDRMNLL